MQCPKCKSATKVTQTRPSTSCDKRWRICTNCGFDFTTLERICVDAGEPYGVCEVSPIQPTVSFKNKIKTPPPSKFVALPDDDLLKGISATIKPLLCQWWNSSRWQKHKNRAVWSQDAFVLSIQRVHGLPVYLQEELAKAGVEHGWQALKPSYINHSPEEKSSPEGGLAPKDPAMNEAIKEWQNKAS